MSDPHADQDGFTDHYLRELEALRKEGTEFAERYPKVAARLRLDEHQVQHAQQGGDQQHARPQLDVHVRTGVVILRH